MCSDSTLLPDLGNSPDLEDRIVLRFAIRLSYCPLFRRCKDEMHFLISQEKIKIKSLENQHVKPGFRY